MNSKLAIPILLLTITCLHFSPFKQQDDELQDIAFHPANKTYDGSSKEDNSQSRCVYIVQAKKWLHKKSINSILKRSAGTNSVVFYGWQKIKDITASAPGMDNQHHLVNSFLVGYSPFRTSNIFIPWQTLAKKKKYQLDHLSRGRNEVWQNSREAYKYSSGDCEDHAIALADWLIDMGLDARVVIGKYKGSGHAWVVLLKDNHTFLLEATRKKRMEGLRSYPLAKLNMGYQPEYMFNRTLFWKNTGSVNTVNYSSSAWVKKSKYKRGS